MFMNSFFAMIFMIAYGLFRGGPTYFKTKKMKHHCIKGLIGIATGTMILYSLENTTLSEFYLVIFTAPLWVVVFSRFMMGEKLDIFRSIVVLLGFMVVAYAFMPEDEFDLNLGVVSASIAALTIGFNMIFIRKYLKGEPPALIGGFSSLIIFAALAFFAIPELEMGMLKHLHIFALIGLCILFGTILLARGYHMATHAMVVAPMHYVQMIYGTLFGLFLFAEVPEPRIVQGLVELAFLGLCLFVYDIKVRKKKKKYYDAITTEP